MRKSLFLIIALSLIFITNCSLIFETPSRVVSTIESSRYVLVYSGATDGNLKKLLDQHNVVVIRNGEGGSIKGMLDTLFYLKHRPDKAIVIDGPCYSACTMLLGAKNSVRLTKRARMLFHSGSISNCKNGVIHTKLSPAGNRAMLKVFGPNMRTWIHESKAYSSLSFTEFPPNLLREWYADMFIPERLIQYKRAVYLRTPSKPLVCN